MSEIISVGLDSGFAYGIMVCNDKDWIIENYIEEIPKSQALVLASEIDKIDTENIIFKYDNKYYAVGKKCSKNYRDTTHRYSKDRMSIFHLIEILSLLGFASTSSEYDVNICLGLPNFLRGDKSSFEKWFKRSYEFSYLCSMGEIRKKINIKNVDLIPQPYAPIFVLPSEKQTKFICSLDIGYGTCDFLLIDNYTIIRQPGTLSHAEGVMRAYKLLRELLLERSSELGIKKTDFSDKLLQTIMESGEYWYEDKKQDIDDILKFVLNKYADYVYQQCESFLGQYLSDVDIFMASGGMLCNKYFEDVLIQKFRSSYNKPFMLSDRPQYNIAAGEYVYAVLKFKNESNDTVEEVAVDGDER